MRVLVDDGKAWLTPSGALALCEKALLGGYTDLVVSVWHGSGPRWFTTYDGLSWESAAAKPRYDPMSILLSYATYRGLKVWASFTCGIQQLPSIHPEWTYIQSTQWTRFYDWTQPSFRSWIAGLIGDYVAYHPETPGLFLDYARFFETNDGGPLAGDPDGRVSFVTDGVHQIIQAARAISPAIRSMSFSNVDGSVYQYHRTLGNDGRIWFQQGLIQHANCPVYQVDPRPRLTEIDNGTADLPDGTVIPSIATYKAGTQPRTPGELLFYVEAQRALFPVHTAHYFTPTLTDQAAACLKVIA